MRNGAITRIEVLTAFSCPDIGVRSSLLSCKFYCGNSIDYEANVSLGYNYLPWQPISVSGVFVLYTRAHVYFKEEVHPNIYFWYVAGIDELSRMVYVSPAYDTPNWI